MRNFLRFGFVLLFFSFRGFEGVGQDFKCGTPVLLPKEFEEIKVFNREFDKQKALTIKQGRVQAVQLTVKVKVHIVRRTNMSGGVSIPELNDIFTTLRNKLNVYPLNINLEYLPTIDYIDDNYYYDFGVINSAKEDAMCNSRDATHAVNLYFIGTLNGAGGYARLPTSHHRFRNRIVIPVEGVSSSSLFNYNLKASVPHEFGHYFNLLHTFGNSNGDVLSTELANGSNCNTAGDLICDTSADPYIDGRGDCKRYNYLTGNCFWGGSLYGCNYTDVNGSSYNPPINNQMSYWTRNDQCWDNFYFTSGQYNVMEGGRYLREGYAYTTDLSQRYYLDGVSRTILRYSGSTLLCAGNTVNLTLNSYGDPSYCQGYFYVQIKPINDYAYSAYISTGVYTSTGEVNITGTIPSNTPAGYYKMRVCKGTLAPTPDYQEVTIYINGTTNSIPTGSPITSQYALATTTLYNATSTCAGNYIQLSSDVYGYDSYRWTKDGVYLTSTSTSNYLNATTTGAYTLKMMKCGTEYTSPNSIYLRFYDLSPPILTASIAGGISSNTMLNICDGTSVSLSANCQAGDNPIWDNGTTTLTRNVYVNASSTANFSVKCSNYFCTTANAPPVRIVNQPFIQSTKTGNWQDPTMWSCNCVPINCQTVTVQNGHTVNVPINDAKAKNILIRGNLNFQNVSPTVKGKVGLGI
jgi:hypothetical protein